MDRIRVLRVVEYEGPRDWVEATVAKSIHGVRQCGSNVDEKVIRAATVYPFPVVVVKQKIDTVGGISEMLHGS